MSQCVRNTIVDKIIGNATSYTISKDKKEIFVPAKVFGLNAAYRIAQRLVKKANDFFDANIYGPVASLNTSYSDGVGVNINPPKTLVDAYEAKEGKKPNNSIIIPQANFERDINYFNQDQALLDQELSDISFSQLDINKVPVKDNTLMDSLVRTMTSEKKTLAEQGNINAQQEWIKEEISEFYDAIKGKDLDEIGEETLGVFRTAQQFPNVANELNPYLPDIFNTYNTFNYQEQFVKWKDKKTRKGQAKEVTANSLLNFINTLANKASETLEDKRIAIANQIKTLPMAIFNTVEILDEVPEDVLGNENLFLSLKEILGEVGVTDKDIIGNYNKEWDEMGDDYPYDFIVEEREQEQQFNRDAIRNDLAQLNTVEEFNTYMNNFDEENPIYRTAYSLFAQFPDFLKNDYSIARKAVESNPDNINFVNQTVPFYKELALIAVAMDYRTFGYLRGEILQDPDVLNLYNRLRQAAEDAFNNPLPFSKTDSNLIQGYYNPNTDKVAIIASNISIKEAAKVAIHEVAHRGMIRMAKELGGLNELGEVLFAAEAQLMEKLPLLLKRTGHKNLESLLRDYGFNKNSPNGKIKLLMELAARWAETLVDKPSPSWWKTLIQGIGNWISQFTGATLSENEVNNLVGGFVNYGTQQSGDVTTKTSVVPMSEDLEGGEIAKTLVYYQKEEVGEILTENDGIYMTVFNTNINGPKNTGTIAYLKLAREAMNNGVQLRSDRISDRLSEPAKKLWQRMVRSGLAIEVNNHYLFNENPETVSETEVTGEEVSQVDESNIENNEELTNDISSPFVNEKLNSKFDELVEKGIISQICI